MNAFFWEHLAVTRQDSTLLIFRNGSQVGSGSRSEELRLDRIGGKSGGTGQDAYAGQAADFRAWDHARDAATIQTFMSYRLSGAEAGLLGYWPMG